MSVPAVTVTVRRDGRTEARTVPLSVIRYGVDNGRDGISASLVFSRTEPDAEHPIAYVPEGCGSRFYLRAEEVDEAEVVSVRHGRRSCGRVFRPRRRVLGRGLYIVKDQEMDRGLIRRPIADPGVPAVEAWSPALVQASSRELVTLAAFAVAAFAALASFHHNLARRDEEA